MSYLIFFSYFLLAHITMATNNEHSAATSQLFEPNSHGDLATTQLVCEWPRFMVGSCPGSKGTSPPFHSHLVHNASSSDLRTALASDGRSWLVFVPMPVGEGH